MLIQTFNTLTGQFEWTVADAEDDEEAVAEMVANSQYLDMLNDAPRNVAYSRAIKRCVAPGDHVLDIGTGTGLLAMLAAQQVLHPKPGQPAGHVSACEVYPPMVALANRLVALNDLAEGITVIGKRSDELTVTRSGQPGDLPRQVDAIVTEIFDSELLGEGVLPTLRHAVRHLLKEGGVVIPAGAILYGQVVESELLWQCRSATAAQPAASALHVDPLFSDHLTSLSAPFELFRFDFHNVPDDRSADLEVELHTAGRPHALVIWWELHMCADNTSDMRISTAPGWISQPRAHHSQPAAASQAEHVCAAEVPAQRPAQQPAWRDHWKQCWLPLGAQQPVSRHDAASILHLTAHHDDHTVTVAYTAPFSDADTEQSEASGDARHDSQLWALADGPCSASRRFISRASSHEALWTNAVDWAVSRALHARMDSAPGMQLPGGLPDGLSQALPASTSAPSGNAVNTSELEVAANGPRAPMLSKQASTAPVAGTQQPASTTASVHCLVTGQGSLVPRLAASHACVEHVMALQQHPACIRYLRQAACQAGIAHKLSIQLEAGCLDGAQAEPHPADDEPAGSAPAEVFLAEPSYTTCAGLLPWAHLHFWHLRDQLCALGRLSAEHSIVPWRGRLRAVAVSLPALWASRQPVGNVEGVNLQLGNRLLGALPHGTHTSAGSAGCQASTEEEPPPERASPAGTACVAASQGGSSAGQDSLSPGCAGTLLSRMVWQCGAGYVELSERVEVLSLDFRQPVHSVVGTATAVVRRSGLCHAVVLWLEYDMVEGSEAQEHVLRTGPDPQGRPVWLEQAVFLMADPLYVCAAGTELQGSSQQAGVTTLRVEASFLKTTGEVEVVVKQS